MSKTRLFKKLNYLQGMPLETTRNKVKISTSEALMREIILYVLLFSYLLCFVPKVLKDPPLRATSPKHFKNFRHRTHILHAPIFGFIYLLTPLAHLNTQTE
jgi:hypothetical protein